MLKAQVGIRIALAVVGWSTYLYLPQKPIEAAWARFYAMITPNAQYEYRSTDEHPHRVRVEFPNHPSHLPPYCVALIAPECTHLHLAAACFPLLVARVRRESWLVTACGLCRAAVVAIGLAVAMNAVRLVLLTRLEVLDYPTWIQSPWILYHDIPNYAFFSSGVLIAFAIGHRWLRRDFARDEVVDIRDA